MTIDITTFPALSGSGLCRHAFLGRAAGLDVDTDRETALRRLAVIHQEVRRELGFGHMAFVTGEQVHGAAVGVASTATLSPVPAVDALITNQPDVCLGMYVADCCAVYAVDTRHRAIGLAHSGKKGTELRVVPAMIARMQALYGTDPARTLVQLSPCIRPPHYEIDFAAEIVRQCRDIGVIDVVDCGACTAKEPDRYYSYRMAKGRTGRMLALLAMAGER